MSETINRDDVISRADAIEAVASRDETDGTVKVFTGRQVNEILSALPSAEADSRVYCKNCKHRYMDGEVTHYYWCRLHDRPVDDTDYCAWGEERSEE